MNNNRKEIAYAVRETAARLAHDRNHPRHISNGDEQKFRNYEEGSPPYAPSYLMSFTKGMPHNDKTGLVKEPVDFQSFVKGVDSGNPRDFKEIQLGRYNSCANTWRSTKANGAEVRAWESQGAGLTFDLEGPDAHAVTMPPAPALGSLELTAEIAEVYAQALLRDVPFTKIADETGISPCLEDITVKTVLENLGKLKWFSEGKDFTQDCHERSRKRMSTEINGKTAFRGITPGDDIGPYISQFLLAGNKGINKKDEEHTNSHGYITYGALNIDQRVRAAKCCSDHMTQWEEWLDVQEGANLSGMEEYDTQLCGKHTVKRRFITTGRDLATYVHYDALYEAYLNACLILMGLGVPYDPDIPYQTKDCMDHQQGFAHFGGPHILSLVTEVATRALKAVRFQKFNVHRRLRPEALAARLSNHAMMPDELSKELLGSMLSTEGLTELLSLVEKKNEKNGKDLNPPPNTDYKNYLLPMAFCEGSPMHPSYGAGHATVAGACVTILKAFFDHKHPLTIAGSDQRAFVPTEDGCCLKEVDVTDGRLTVEGELNKLASNISIGRNWAGVHYFSDYIESLRMGEQIAIGILEEQKITYGENFSMTVPLFDGGAIRI